MGEELIDCNSRGKGRVNLSSQIVRVEDEHADHECEEDHDEEHHELEDVLHSASQRDLQRAEAFVGWEDVSNTREAQDHSDGVQAL